MLSLLSAYWHEHTDLRLGQIVGNFTPRHQYPVQDEMGEYLTDRPGDSYYVEDDVIEQALVKVAPPHLLPVCYQRGIGGRVAGDCAVCGARATCENPKRVGAP
jgi:hypothetical protein